MIDAPVRFALVGYGSGGRVFHAPLIASLHACELVGIVTASDERRARARADHPSVDLFESLEALADADVEAVAISTPADTHSDLTDRALRLGLHVVCDKPFSIDAASAARSAALADELGRRLSPYQNRRWDSDFLTIRSLLDARRLGHVVRFESRFERFAPERGPGPAGGGTLLDFCSHLVDQALVLFGSVSSVYAEWRLRDTGRDDDVFIALAHDEGVRSHLSASWSQGAPERRFRVTGTEGAYIVDGLDGQEAALVAGATPRSLGAGWGIEASERWGSVCRGDDVDVVPTLAGAWPRFYEEFAAAVRDGGRVPVSAWDAVETARVLDAARRSAESGTLTRPEGVTHAE